MNVLISIRVLIITFLFIVGVEYFFRLNETHGWFARLDLYHADMQSLIASHQSVSHLDLPYIKHIPPQNISQRCVELPDYDHAYDFSKCPSDDRHFLSNWIFRAPGCPIKINLKTVKSGQNIFSAAYTADAFMRRIVPATHLRSSKKLILMGCSFTFGEGLNDNETFADHLARASALIRFFDIDLPIISQSEIDFYSDMIALLKSESMRSLGASRFVYAIFPGERVFAKMLVPSLLNRGIEVLDYSKINPNAELNQNAYIRCNGHPTPMLAHLYADLLNRDLSKKNE